MWELDHKEGWAPKNWCFWIVVLEKTLEIHLVCKEVRPVNPKGNQPWTFIGRTDIEAEAPILWPPDMKSQLIGKDPDVGKDWRQEVKETTKKIKADRVSTVFPSICHEVMGPDAMILVFWMISFKSAFSFSFTFIKRLFSPSSISATAFPKVTQSCPTLCNPMNSSTPGFPVLHYLPEFAQTHVHWVGGAIQPSHPLLPASLP